MNLASIKKILNKDPLKLGASGVAIGSGGIALADQLRGLTGDEQTAGDPLVQGLAMGAGGASLPALLGVRDPKKLALYSLLSGLGLGGMQAGLTQIANKRLEADE